jgi:hypothetical protein
VLAGLAERVAALLRRNFAHLARCATAIFRRTEALIPRLFVEEALELFETPSMRSSSWFRFSIRSLIETARLS